MLNVCFLLQLAVIAAMAGLSGCSSDAPASKLPTTKMQIGNRTFTLEIASNDDDRMLGLMYRKSMPDDHGMIFIFTDEQPRSFWMKNTEIPLDILYVDAKGQVVSIHQMEPYVLKSVHSAAAARFAIELNQGAASKSGVKVGDVLQIPPEAQKATE